MRIDIKNILFLYKERWELVDKEMKNYKMNKEFFETYYNRSLHVHDKFK